MIPISNCGDTASQYSSPRGNDEGPEEVKSSGLLEHLPNNSPTDLSVCINFLFFIVVFSKDVHEAISELVFNIFDLVTLTFINMSLSLFSFIQALSELGPSQTVVA